MATKASAVTPMVPAMKELTAAMASAAPARPLRAMGYPSSTVITAAASPGVLSRIAVTAPPYMQP